MDKHQIGLFRQSRIGGVALFSLFCAAAGVYAAESDGWKYKDPEKIVIENTGDGEVARTSSIAKGETFDDASEIGGVSKVEIEAGKASFVSAVKGDSSLSAVVFDGEENAMSMKENAILEVNSSIDADGNPAADKDAIGVIFSEEAQKATLDGKGQINVTASKDATGIKGANVGDLSFASVNVESVNGGKATALDISGNAGSIKAESVSALSSASGASTALSISGDAGDITINRIQGDVVLSGNTSSLTSEALSGDVKINNIGRIDVVLENATMKVGDVGESASIGGRGSAIIGNTSSLLVDSTGDENFTMRGQNVDVIGSQLDINANIENGGNVTTGNLNSVDVNNASTFNPDTSAPTTLNFGDVKTSVNVANSTINVNAGTVAGDVTLESLKGNASFESTQSTVLVTGDGIGGYADNLGGNLTIKDAQGDVKADANIGSVDIRFTNDSSLSFSSISDSATVELAGGELKGNGNEGSGTIGGHATIKGFGTIDIAADSLHIATTDASSISIDGAGKVTVDDPGGLSGNVDVTGGDFAFDAAENLSIDGLKKPAGDESSTNNIKIKDVANANVTNGLEGNLSIGHSDGVVEIDRIDGKLTVEDLSGKGRVIITESAKELELKLNGGSLTADGGAVVDSAVVNGNGTVDIIGSVKDFNSDLIVGDVTIGTSTGKAEDGVGGVNVGTIDGKLTVKDAQGTVAIRDFVQSVDVNLNGGELEFGENASALDTVVSGQGNANIADVQNELKVGQDGREGLIGNLTVSGEVGAAYIDKVDGDVSLNKVVNEAFVSNVTGNIAIGDLGEENSTSTPASATIRDSVSATVENAYGDVRFENMGASATVNNSNAEISAKDVAGGLNVGNVADIGVENTNVNVLDGGKVSGNIVSQGDMTLSNGGSAELAGGVEVNGNLNLASEGFDVTHDTQGAVVKADSISGDGAKALVDNYYDKKYGFSAKDDSLIKVSTLVGTHDSNAASSDGKDNKLGHIEGSLGELNLAVENRYVDVTYNNKSNDGTVSNSVNYTVDRNSYLQDTYAKTENEKALAKVFDNLAFQNDAEADALSVSKKNAIASNPSLLSAMLPQSISHAARLNMDLGDMMHMDTLYRTSLTRDMLNLNKYERLHKLLRETTIVSVRNINKFSSYGGDANIDGSDDYVYGGLLNLERVFSKDLFVGVGVGGFEAESDGKGMGNKAESQSFALNAYADWSFYDNFDWYLGFNYSLNINEARRQSFDGVNTANWNSNLVGFFTGLRYSWKPVEDRNFFIKPTLGMNANFLLNPSITEDSASDMLKVDSDDFTSVKILVGVEATYAFENGFYLAGRMFYTHEFGDDSYDLNAMFMNSPSLTNSFRMRGLEMDRDSGIFGFGVGYDITKAWRIYLDYAAEVTGDVYHNVNAGVQFRF